ncbi:LLM class F420-dependent oxidoreductase [Streptomyces sp. MMG1121]|uniref:LLM class F420-dependent oxidoreductase n=1 Tax=Streptomyces sp. MMG1121 TaxID=1415544 RepID=UPI0006B06A24|nr:LLM class F420-dependent oxidoreductase [Streptomyces sp. MMG1121]KOV61141.1 5,10-methylene tetrahydromethanopterin reductase [Streptomyces sp. MMG1121]
MGSFRFGVAMHSVGGREEWAKKCRRAERFGYDVILVPDHLGFPAPFSAMVAAAEATERPRVGSFVLNTSFWNPTLLGRDVITADQLTDGRLELGLGAGHRKEEFEATGIAWRPLAERIDHLERTMETLATMLADETQAASLVQRPRPPLFLGGNSDRMLQLGAAHADIMGFTALAKAPGPRGFRILTAEAMAERVAYFRTQAGNRADEVELNILVRDVVITDDRNAQARRWHEQTPDLTLDEFLEAPAVLIGTVDEIADQVRAWRDRFGYTYLTVHEPWMETFAPVVEALEGE